MHIIKTLGRTTIYANYTEQELLSGTKEEIDSKVIDIIKNSIDLHNINEQETYYLQEYYKGRQDVLNKVKLTRPEINNKTVENWTYAMIDFKKTYLLGKPIQYVQLDNVDSEEIAVLNRYVRYENKKAKDMLLYEDVLKCGRAYRYVNYDKINEEDEAPFEIINTDVKNTEVVYSSKLGHEQLLSFIKTSMKFIYQGVDPETGEKKVFEYPYEEYTVYLRNKCIVMNNKDGDLIITSEKPLIINEHIIKEYYINQDRLSMIEIGKSLFDDINYLESLDKDDLEQYVNSIMVFTNAQIDTEKLGQIKELGAVSIKSTEQQKASVELLQSRLKSSDTESYYNRLVGALQQILGIPSANNNGSITYGDTGVARLTGQGFTSAGIRAQGDETLFAMCDLESLKTIVKICKTSPNSLINNLKISNIDIKFQRDMSENLLVKTQALNDLYKCDIPRNIANGIVNLFSDSNAVTIEQEKMFGEQVSQLNSNKQNNTQSTNNNINNGNIDTNNLQNNNK